MYLFEIAQIFLLYNFFTNTQAKITDEEYALMPQLFHVDNFDECMDLGNRALYCSIVVQLSPEDPKNRSASWNIIEKVVRDPRYYRHDLLRHGICVPKSCPAVDIYTNDELMLKRGFSKCYTSKYNYLGLKATATEIHCETDQPFYMIDNYDIAVALLLGILIWIVIFATFYEGIARYKSKEEYYEITNTRVGRFISCFSIPKNWNRLRSETTNSETETLKGIQGIRFYNTQLVMMAHVAMMSFVGPVINPTFTEEMTLRPQNILFNNGHCIIQTFMVITGFLISYNFLLLFEKRKEFELRYIISAFINRYIRLTPCLLVMIALNSTWLNHLARGPSWDRLVGAEYRNCRKNWWTNLLYINNFYDAENICMQHTWYLAADTQLFLLSLIVVTFMWKYQKRIKLILGICVAIGVAMPSVVNYYHDFDIAIRPYPEAYYSIFVNLPQWRWIYTSPLTSVGGYALGLTFGYISYSTRNKKVFTTKMRVLVWWVLVWGLPLGVINYGILIYQDGYQYTRIGAAVYVTLHRNLFALGICLLIFGMTQGIGWFIRECLVWSPLQVFGRLTYCTYLVHVAIMRVRGGQARLPSHISYYTLFNQTVGDSVVSYIFAILLALYVELPISALQKMIVSRAAKEVPDSTQAKVVKATKGAADSCTGNFKE